METEQIIVEYESKSTPVRDLREFKYARRKYSASDLTLLTDLKSKYKSLTNSLNEEYKDELTVTRSEKNALRFLKKITKLEILRSVWIGNHCIDLFIPALGYAIEIDGSIHNKEFKMRKDTARDVNLAFIGIHVMSLPNGDLEKLINWFAFSFNDLRGKSTYQKRRMWRDIYILTLLRHKALFVSQMEVANEF